MKIRKLHHRILIALALLLLAVQAASLALTNTMLVGSARDDIERSLATGEQVFNRLRDNYSRQLALAAGVLSADFAFREAIATADHATVASVLANHGARINADVVMLVGPDGNVIADRTDQVGRGKPFPFGELISEAEQHGNASGVVAIDGAIYQLVVVPVLAPLPIAWLAVGLRIDDAFARDLRSLTGLDFTFLTRSGGQGPGKVVATTIPPERAGGLAEALAAGTLPAAASVKTINLDGEEIMARVAPLSSGHDPAIIAVLQRSVHQALQPLRRLQLVLLALGGVFLVAAMIASHFMALGITAPISRLGNLASRIAGGEFPQSEDAKREDEIGSLAAAFNQMSTGTQAREQRITELAYRDQLTGLPNRTLFSERLVQAIKTARRAGAHFAILIIDLDRFKEVNDILGHHIGDLLLQTLARRLEGVVKRDTDTVARLGGDEFAILLPNTDGAGARIIARKCLEALDQPTLLEGQNIIASGSIGVCVFPDHGEELNTLLRHADLAMYEAKHHNSGYAVFDASYEERSQEHLSLMSELRHAVAHGELVLYYQPKVSLTDGTVGEVEALLRWQHPQRGLIPPGEFIPFAENTGYIRTLTAWVIEEALRQRRQWQEQRLPLTISINISTRDLMNIEFPQRFRDLMQAYGAAPGWLSLEVTESAIMADPQRALNVLEELHAMGLAVAVDDFGTGYSSLAYLKKMPVSQLKIDQSFVRNMENDKDDAVIVRSTIDLGHNIGLKAVAEGVENEATWVMLAEMGCDLAQGYHISRPVDADALARWLRGSHWKLPQEN